MRFVAIGLVVLAGMGGASSRVTRHHEASQNATPLYEYEAQTLLFLTPGIQGIVGQGFKVKFGLETGPGFNQKVFYVYRAMGETDAPSNLIGNYAVNKYTAEVLNMDTGRVVQSSDLAAVQQVLRRVHHIGRATIERYKGVEP